ncbi:hypothetical protein [Salinifilum ghardaiensis]
MAVDDPAAHLPPRPDPNTGEPAPPAAPTQHPGGYNEKRWSKPPAPPPDQGPTLAYFRERKLVSWFGGLIPPAVAMTAFVLHGGLSAFTKWPLWVIAAILYGWSVYVQRANRVAAGADWLSIRQHWVKTYELTKIAYNTYGTNQPCLMLQDADDRSVEIPISTVEGDRTVWNYVYLGMRHSAANGAKLNRNARNAYPDLTDTNRRANSENQ